jgi:hypothetical protein
VAAKINLPLVGDPVDPTRIAGLSAKNPAEAGFVARGIGLRRRAKHLTVDAFVRERPLGVAAVLISPSTCRSAAIKTISNFDARVVRPRSARTHACPLQPPTSLSVARRWPDLTVYRPTRGIRVVDAASAATSSAPAEPCLDSMSQPLTLPASLSRYLSIRQ